MWEPAVGVELSAESLPPARVALLPSTKQYRRGRTLAVRYRRSFAPLAVEMRSNEKCGDGVHRKRVPSNALFIDKKDNT